MLKPGSFDVCMNATAPMIAILGCSEVDIGVLDVDMKTMEFDNFREVLGDNRDANGILAMI